jgi:hypothetical protein
MKNRRNINDTNETYCDLASHLDKREWLMTSVRTPKIWRNRGLYSRVNLVKVEVNRARNADLRGLGPRSIDL